METRDITPVTGRRSVARAAAILTAGLTLSAAARAATTDLVVHCDPPLAAPMQAIAAAYRANGGGAQRIFPTAPNAIPAQLAREIQNDLVFTQPDILARIRADGLLGDAPPSSRWRNRLVIARRKGDSARPIDQALLAAPDPGWGGGPDGPALLRGAGISPGRVIGTFDTDEARALLLSGEVAYALLHATELGDDLAVVDVPGLTAERIAIAAITKSTRRPNPQAIMRFLTTPEAAAILRQSGLEPAS